MAAPTDMNPLCQTELCKALFETGRSLHNAYPRALTPGWGVHVPPTDCITHVRMAGDINSKLVGYIILENLKLVLDSGTGGGILQRLTSLEAACDRTHHDLATGASPEFNDLIGRIVEQKIREVLPQAGSSTDVDDQPVARSRKKTTEEKILEAKTAIEQQVAELNDLVVPGLSSDEGRVKTKILNKSVEAQTIIRNPAVEARERNRRLHVWIAYLIKKNGQRLSQVSSLRSPFWEVVERMRQSANTLIYNLEKSA